MELDVEENITWLYDYDGYRSQPIWKRPEDESSYFSLITDTQCVLPLPTLDELEKQAEEW